MIGIINRGGYGVAAGISRCCAAGAIGSAIAAAVAIGKACDAC